MFQTQIIFILITKKKTEHFTPHLKLKEKLNEREQEY